MQENKFKELFVFEDQRINTYCDLLTDEVYRITGKKPHLVGSVAKIMSEMLPKDYNPKDVDFAVDAVSFRKLLQKNREDPVFSFARMTELRPERFILYFEDRCIEVWATFKKNNTERIELFKKEIPYLCP